MTPTPCPEMTSLIVRVADGSATTAERERLDAHMTDCLVCAAALEGQRDAHDALAALAAMPPLPISPAFRARLDRALAAERTHLPAPFGIDARRWTWRLVPLAASIAVLAIYGAATIQPTWESVDPAMDEATVPVALFDSEVTEASLLSLLVGADADAALSLYLQEGSR